MSKPQESIADFKQRIALMMRNREGNGKVYSMVGAARPDPCVVRPKTTLADTNQHGILEA